MRDFFKNKKIPIIFFTAYFLSTGLAIAGDSYHYPQEIKEKNLKRYQLFKAYVKAMSVEAESVPGYSEAGRLDRNMKLYDKKLSKLSGRSPVFAPPAMATVFASTPFIASPNNLEKVRNFLEKNISDTEMPLSFRASADYWRRVDDGLDPVEAVIERTVIQNDLNIYDGALWQMALMILPSAGSRRLVDLHTDRLSRGEAGDLHALRAYGGAFRYGDGERMMNSDNGFFFRMITDHYIQEDPLGQDVVAGFPNFSRVHYEDWKPITGEQAWAVIIGPLQAAYQKYGGHIPEDCAEKKLALSVLPALQAMQSPIGAFYHAPSGTYGIHSKLIVMENNISVYAALKMLEQVLGEKGAKDLKTVKKMIVRLEYFFKKYAYDAKDHRFYIGGYYIEKKFVSMRLLASDCQTWAIPALGPGWIDAHFGKGEAYQILQKTLELSGRRDVQGALEGIGYTSDRAVVSVEWTCGAILAARLLADFYKPSHPDWSQALLEQAAQMRSGIEKYKTDISPGASAYLYASDRYFIPFGWWANPVPSVSSSAWVIFTDLFYNPFILGGGPGFQH